MRTLIVIGIFGLLIGSSFGIIIMATNSSGPSQNDILMARFGTSSPVPTREGNTGLSLAQEPTVAPTIEPTSTATPTVVPAQTPAMTPEVSVSKAMAASTSMPAPEPTATATTRPATATPVPATATPFPTPTFVDDNEVRFSEMYESIGPRGAIFSDKLESLAGETIEMRGYMAPPLKPALDFFVLTRLPMATCPFCTTDADWPVDIVFVRMPEGEMARPTDEVVHVEGTLQIGSATDDKTGFVSQVRIMADEVTVLN